MLLYYSFINEIDLFCIFGMRFRDDFLCEDNLFEGFIFSVIVLENSGSFFRASVIFLSDSSLLISATGFGLEVTLFS